MTELSELMDTPTMVQVVPFKHQLGKFIVASIVTFAAAQLASKAYDSTLTLIHNRAAGDTPLVEG